MSSGNFDIKTVFLLLIILLLVGVAGYMSYMIANDQDPLVLLNSRASSEEPSFGDELTPTISFQSTSPTPKEGLVTLSPNSEDSQSEEANPDNASNDPIPDSELSATPEYQSTTETPQEATPTPTSALAEDTEEAPHPEKGGVIETPTPTPTLTPTPQPTTEIIYVTATPTPITSLPVAGVGDFIKPITAGAVGIIIISLFL